MSSSNRSSTSTENSTTMQWDPPICPVCEITAPNGKHFGIICCGACAAFFRRTVSEQKLFQCTKGAIETVTFFPSLLQACRHCRYLKCIKAGMKLEKVQTKRSKTAVPIKHINVINVSVGELIDTIVKGNHYVERERCIEYGPLNIEFKKSTMSGAVSIAKTELRLMQDFLQNNGLLNLIPANHLKDFIKQGYYLWAQTSSLWLSYTQGGYSANRMCYVDRSFVDINELAVERIYSVIPGIRHVDTIVRHAMPVYFEFRSILRLIQIYRLDHVEWLIVVHILFANLVITQFALTKSERSQVNNYLKKILNELHKYHEDNYKKEQAIRLGNMTLFIEAIQQSARAVQEQITVLLLCGYKTTVQK